MTRSLLACVFVLFASSAFAQTPIPPPTAPLVFCGSQASPEAVSYQLVFDGAAPEAVTMDATMNAACPTGSTHSFQLPASRFTVGKHTVMIRSVNAFGATDGPVYDVTVGIVPGKFTINAVIGK